MFIYTCTECIVLSMQNFKIVIYQENESLNQSLQGGDDDNLEFFCSFFLVNGNEHDIHTHKH